MTWADVVGYAGLAFGCLWSFAPSRRAMVMVQLLGNLSFLVHWLLNGSITGAAMTGLMMTLTGLSFFFDGQAGPACVRLFRLAYALALFPVAILSIVTWAGLPSLFAAFGTAVGCYARWQADPARYRAGVLWSSAPWLAHDILVGSWPAGLSDLFGLSRGMWLLWRDSRPVAPAGAT